MAVANLLDHLWNSLERGKGGQARATFDRAQKRFAPCPSTPNCVSTQAPATDTEHSIEPIAYTDTLANARHHLLTVVRSMPSATVVIAEPDYLHVEFRSRLMRFVDDIEFYLDDVTHLIHFRSASRLGQSDLGVNRKRMEEIRQKFGKQ